METVSWEDFKRIKLVAGTIVKVEDFLEAKNPAYKIWVNFGEYGEKKSSAQITTLYTKEELIGKKIIAVINFPPKQIGPFKSEFLITGFYRNSKEVVLAVCDKDVPDGSELG